MIKPADETLMGPKLSNWNKLCVCVPLHDWLVQQQTFHWFGDVKDKRRLSIFRPVRTTSEKFGNAKNHRSLTLCIWGKLGQENDINIVVSSFLTSSAFKMFSAHGVFKFLRFEERYRKAPFSWRITADGRPNRRNKPPLSNFPQHSVDGTSVRLIRRLAPEGWHQFPAGF